MGFTRSPGPSVRNLLVDAPVETCRPRGGVRMRGLCSRAPLYCKHMGAFVKLILRGSRIQPSRRPLHLLRCGGKEDNASIPRKERASGTSCHLVSRHDLGSYARVAATFREGATPCSVSFPSCFGCRSTSRQSHPLSPRGSRPGWCDGRAESCISHTNQCGTRGRPGHDELRGREESVFVEGSRPISQAGQESVEGQQVLGLNGLAYESV